MRLPFGRSAPPIEAAAFADLYQAHLAAVFDYCLFRVGDRHIAEDLTADVFERDYVAAIIIPVDATDNRSAQPGRYHMELSGVTLGLRGPWALSWEVP